MIIGDLAGKVIPVTGVSGAIGFETAAQDRAINKTRAKA